MKLEPITNIKIFRFIFSLDVLEFKPTAISIPRGILCNETANAIIAPK